MKIEDPNVPYIEKPDMVDIPEDRSGLFCFIDSARPCEADCMAYLGVRPEGKDYEGQQWAKCLLLVNAHKTGKHAVSLASQADSLLKHLRVKSADARREAQLPIVPVR
jgi:hypothetical protein